MNGSARGTALVVVLLAAPILVASSRRAARASRRAQVVWAGCLAYLAYNGVMFLFATPYNRLFPLYVGMLSLSIWALITLLTAVRPERLPVTRELRTVAAYMWVIVALNTAVWLKTIVPDLLDANPGSFTAGTGVATNPVFVQDLTLWLPAIALAGWLLWSGQRHGWLLAGAGLVYWQLEALSVAADQWWGHRADPSSDIVSTGAVPLFVAMFLIGLAPCWLLLRSLSGANGAGAEDHRPSPRDGSSVTVDS
jgi:hypothetical protein